MKNTLIRIVNYEKTTFDKKIIWKVRHGVRQLRKKLSNILRPNKAYGLKISQSIIYVRNIFICFSLPWKILYKDKERTNHWISRYLMIIFLVGVSDECFSFKVNVKASLKFLWALRGKLDTLRTLGHLGNRMALEGHLDTRSLKALRHSGN